jgi:hypothetical protein
MKRFNLIFLSILTVLSLVSFTSACELRVNLLNQDPYPAVQGDLVKLVFQLEGIESKECQNVEVQLIESYPFTLDPGSPKSYKVASGTFVKDFRSSFMAPFKVRVADDALNGESPIEIQYTYGTDKPGHQTRSFDVEVQDVRADFEIYVRDYDPTNGNIVFEVLNIGKHDIEALVLEILPQEGIDLTGSPRNIVGDLDSNEDTTTEFNLKTEKQEINLRITYSDINNERRTLEKNIFFKNENFPPEESDNTFIKWLIFLALAGLIVWWHIRKIRKVKKNCNK